MQLTSADWWLDTLASVASVNFCPYRSDTITAVNYLLADVELQVFFLQTLNENKIILMFSNEEDDFWNLKVLSSSNKVSRSVPL